MSADFDRRPIVVAVAGPNGAGRKLTFLKEAAAGGYAVVLCFVAISGP